MLEAARPIRRTSVSNARSCGREPLENSSCAVLWRADFSLFVPSTASSEGIAWADCRDRNQREKRLKKSQMTVVLTMWLLLAPTNPQPSAPAPVPQLGSPNHP